MRSCRSWLQRYYKSSSEYLVISQSCTPCAVTMRHLFAVPSLVAIVLLVSSQHAHAIFVFGDCGNLPNATELEGLIRETFRVGDSPPDAEINVRDFNFVCLTPGMFRGTYRKLSVVVSYDCSGSTLCPSASPVSQFDFACNTDEMWIDQLFGTSEFARTNVADATLTTPNRTNCSVCLNSIHRMVVGISLSVYDETTHCVGTYVSTLDSRIGIATRSPE